jgi:hypothetical protein
MDSLEESELLDSTFLAWAFFVSFFSFFPFLPCLRLIAFLTILISPFLPALHAAGQSHGVPTQFHVQDKGVAATTPDLVNLPLPPNFCLSKITRHIIKNNVGAALAKAACRWWLGQAP